MRPEHWRYTIPQRIRSLFKRRTADLELDEELQFHLDQETNELISKGLSEKDARDARLRAHPAGDYTATDWYYGYRVPQRTHS